MGNIFEIFPGRDDKGCLPSTEKKAAVDVDRRRQPVEKSSLHFSTGRRRPSTFIIGQRQPDCTFPARRRSTVDAHRCRSTC